MRFHIPTPEVAGEGEEVAAPAQRRFTEENGDVCFIYSRKLAGDRTRIVARLERKAGDWDVLLEYLTDGPVSDDRVRSYIGKAAAELKKSEQVVAR